ncbi:hypothetical protein KFL_000430270 [Klebsormidium nitens]|uniref:Uncharacterized protein n=1 Tax=Klebsormidium nitens TaxID=105231 RepID=A0A1Y1HMX4_KLENI|nr:hypothetical protein KFL_000430270 [Klebsormidium nitens]|eukprot:GAQ79985.1 hypothetical protein KFL_000430270 [Klebsormidium nitens]
MAATLVSTMSVALAAFLLLADVMTAAGLHTITSDSRVWGSRNALGSAQPSQSTHRKLMQVPTPAPVVSDYLIEFCVEQGIEARQASYLAGFDTTTLYVAINTCGGEPLNTTTDVYNPRVNGTVTQTSIPGGRTISWHVEGSGVFAFIVDALFNPSTSARFDEDTFTDVDNFFLGTRPNEEGFTDAGLSKEDLKSILATATFVWDYSFSVTDGSKPGDPFSPAALGDPTARILRDDMTATISGPLRSTPTLKYPLGNPAVAFFRQVNVEGQGTGPFDFPGSPERAVETEFSLNVLSPTASGARAAALITQVTGNTPMPTEGAPTPTPGSTTGAPTPPTATPVPPTGTPAPTAVGFPVGGVCDASSALPNQCFSSNGARYVCCAGGCPSNPTATPRCG